MKRGGGGANGKDTPVDFVEIDDSSLFCWSLTKQTIVNTCLNALLDLPML
jgi:hypothetical protein